MRSDTQNRPQRVDALLDPATGAVSGVVHFADRPWLDRLIGYGVALHEGQLFAPLNQVLGVVTAAGLITMVCSAMVMWWRRRPASVLGAPPPHDGRIAPVLVGLAVLIGVLLPLFGASLLAVLAIEREVLRRWQASRRFLGLSPPGEHRA